jgi:hypothetical protein
LSKPKNTHSDWLTNYLKVDSCVQDIEFSKSESNGPLNESLKQHLPDFSPISSEEPNINNKNDEFDPQEHLIKGWSGNSLSSKNGIRLTRFLEKIVLDLNNFFQKPNTLNRSLKMSIYNEFITFTERMAINCVGLDDFLSFWMEVNKPHSKHREIIDKFIDIYTNRVAAVYFFKIRFIVILSNKLGIELQTSNINNPNSFLRKIFRENSSTSLSANSLNSNIYSWYRPSPEILPSIENLCKLSNELDFNEITKLISSKIRIKSNDETIYSHSISHKNYGLFINSLLINFPIWLSKINRNKFITPKQFESLSTKFKGDYLESFSVAHWLAQYNNKNIQWHHVICPDFEETDKSPTDFSKIHNELQFLTFLTEIANEQGEESVQFICDIFNQNNKKKVESSGMQKSLFSNNTTLANSKYDRIVLNLSNFPKNNPTHFLINSILEESKNLRPDGFLFVLSNKKLFIPSQKDKVNTLLQQVKIECIINLEDAQGLGEVSNYIYIFTPNHGNQILSSFEDEKKNTCMSFRVNANLESFNQFSEITNHFQDFYRSHLNDAPSMYEKTIGRSNIQFHLDAIVNGRLIHSSGEESNNITHPQFFNNLLKTCIPLDYLFDIRTINRNDYSNDLYI